MAALVEAALASTPGVTRGTAATASPLPNDRSIVEEERAAYPDPRLMETFVHGVLDSPPDRPVGSIAKQALMESQKRGDALLGKNMGEELTCAYAVSDAEQRCAAVEAAEERIKRLMQESELLHVEFFINLIDTLDTLQDQEVRIKLKAPFVALCIGEGKDLEALIAFLNSGHDRDNLMQEVVAIPSTSDVPLKDEVIEGFGHVVDEVVQDTTIKQKLFNQIASIQRLSA